MCICVCVDVLCVYMYSSVCIYGINNCILYICIYVYIHNENLVHMILEPEKS